MKNKGHAIDIRTKGNSGRRSWLILALVICMAAAAATAFAGDIRSKAAVVLDAETGRILYAKNPDMRLLPASTTKLMPALVVLDRAKLSDVATISRKVSLTPAMRVGFREGDKVSVETLLYAALMKSANDAAVALAEEVAGSEEKFVALMNRKAIAIGANDTRFINANGLPGPGQYITAYDLAKIMREAIKYPVLKEIISTRMTEVSTESGKTMHIRNTNKLLWSDEEILGGKTGFTRQARHCFVCAGERDKDTIIVALLGAPVRDLLWKESEELLAFGAKVLNNTEEPVVYLARTGEGRAKVSHAVYTTTSGDGPRKVRYTGATGKKVRRHRVILAKKRSRHDRLHAKLKKPNRHSKSGSRYAKLKKVKRHKAQNMARRAVNEPRG